MTTEPEIETYYVFENEVAEQILGMDTVDQIEFIFPPIDQIPEKHNLISFLFLRLYTEVEVIRSKLNNQTYKSMLDPEVIGDPEYYPLTLKFLADQFELNDKDNQWLLSYINIFAESIINNQCLDLDFAVFIASKSCYLDENVLGEFLQYLHKFYEHIEEKDLFANSFIPFFPNIILDIDEFFQISDPTISRNGIMNSIHLFDLETKIGQSAMIFIVNDISNMIEISQYQSIISEFLHLTEFFKELFYQIIPIINIEDPDSSTIIEFVTKILSLSQTSIYLFIDVKTELINKVLEIYIQKYVSNQSFITLLTNLDQHFQEYPDLVLSYYPVIKDRCEHLSKIESCVYDIINIWNFK